MYVIGLNFAQSRSASCEDSIWIAGSTTPSDCTANLRNGRAISHALASNECSLQTRPAPKRAVPIRKTRNHCAEPLDAVSEDSRAHSTSTSRSYKSDTRA